MLSRTPKKIKELLPRFYFVNRLRKTWWIRMNHFQDRRMTCPAIFCRLLLHKSFWSLETPLFSLMSGFPVKKRSKFSFLKFFMMIILGMISTFEKSSNNFKVCRNITELILNEFKIFLRKSKFWTFLGSRNHQGLLAGDQGLLVRRVKC